MAVRQQNDVKMVEKDEDILCFLYGSEVITIGQDIEADATKPMQIKLRKK